MTTPPPSGKLDLDDLQRRAIHHEEEIYPAEILALIRRLRAAEACAAHLAAQDERLDSHPHIKKNLIKAWQREVSE